MRAISLSSLLVLLSVCASGTVQIAAGAPAQVVTLGNSAVALTGPWKFSPGDSPWVNGSPVWAEPGFDDESWAVMDLTPKAGSVSLITGMPDFVPGWTARGYPDLDGFAWYRLRLHVTGSDHPLIDQSLPGQPLSLKMPQSVDDALSGLCQRALHRAVGQLLRTPRQALLLEASLLSAARAGAGWRDRTSGPLLYVPLLAILRSGCRWHARPACAGAALHRASAAGRRGRRRSAQRFWPFLADINLPADRAAGAMGLAAQLAGAHVPMALFGVGQHHSLRSGGEPRLLVLCADHCG
jgi:hypothetical protein